MSFFDQFKIRTRSPQDGRKRKSDRIEELSVLVLERPDDWATANELADALAGDGRLDEAVTQLCALGDRLAAEGFLARAHAIYKKALRLQPQDPYAASRAAELNTERMNQSRSRFVPVLDDASRIEPVPADMPMVAPAPVAPTAVAEAPSVPVEEPCVSPSAEPDPIEPSEEKPQTIDEMLSEATSAATYGEVDVAVSMLKECARTWPDLIEPVARLAEIATTHGLVDIRDEAEARLCDLHCRRGDYHAARAVAEALAMRNPDDPRHRARLEFVEGELEQSAPLGARAPATETPVTVPDHDAETVMDLEVHDLEVSEPGCDAEPVVRLDETRAALERAAALEEHCFTASRELARVDAEAGDWNGALAWLERAAAAIPGPADEETLAYEIALVLERAGEHERALGVLHEIAAKAGTEYRDISERIVRLSSARDAVREQLVAS